MLTAKFINHQTETEINQNGFVIIPGFLPNEQVEKILSLYKSSHKEREIGCWNSLYNLPHLEGKEISTNITQLVTPFLDVLIEDYKFPVALFISKNPGQGHESLLHRDDSMHYEDQVQYRQCWVPLVDITPDNGPLYIVPKSHLLFKDERPMFAPWPYAHLRNRLEKEFVFLYPKAGDLVVYFEKTLHGSTINQTDVSRPVFQGGLMHKDAEPQFTRYIPERNEVERYAVDYDFFFNKEYTNELINPKYRLISNEKYVVTEIAQSDVDTFFRENNPSRQTSE